MIKTFLMVTMLLQIFSFAYGQDYSKLNLDSLYQVRIALENEPVGPKLTDSLYFLDINITYKLKILKHKKIFSQPYVEIDFPYCYYDSISKTIKLTSAGFSKYNYVSDSTIALIRVGSIADHSFGSGGADYLFEINRVGHECKVDTLIKFDSISSTGLFYLSIKEQTVILERNEKITFIDHKERNSHEALFDFITEYTLKNYGLIKRKFEYGEF